MLRRLVKVTPSSVKPGIYMHAVNGLHELIKEPLVWPIPQTLFLNPHTVNLLDMFYSSHVTLNF